MNQVKDVYHHSILSSCHWGRSCTLQEWSLQDPPESIWIHLISSESGIYMEVSKNSGTPKSSILIRFSIVNHPFWGTLVSGNTHILSIKQPCICWGLGHPSRHQPNDVLVQLLHPKTCKIWPKGDPQLRPILGPIEAGCIYRIYQQWRYCAILCQYNVLEGASARSVAGTTRSSSSIAIDFQVSQSNTKTPSRTRSVHRSVKKPASWVPKIYGMLEQEVRCKEEEKGQGKICQTETYCPNSQWLGETLGEAFSGVWSYLRFLLCLHVALESDEKKIQVFKLEAELHANQADGC